VRRYLVLVPPHGDKRTLYAQLGRLAAREPSQFHVVVPRPTGDDDAARAAAERRLRSVVHTLVTRGLTAGGEVGVVSVVGSVARAAGRARYDAVVIPVPVPAGLDMLGLEIACRLYQVDVPEVVLATPYGATPWRDSTGSGLSPCASCLALGGS
jgi:hypothetical protein